MMARRNVLVVDDDPTRLALTIAMVEECGRKASAANNGEAAQRLIERTGRVIDILITDVRMPGLVDGVSLARWTRAHWPDIRVYVTSGYGLGRDELPEGATFLSKTWLTMDAVKLVLEGGAPRPFNPPPRGNSQAQVTVTEARDLPHRTSPNIVSIDLSKDLAAALDAWIARQRAPHPTRSQAVRLLLEIALGPLEAPPTAPTE